MIKKLKYIIPCILLLLVSIFYSIPVSAVGTTINVGTPYAIYNRPPLSDSASSNCAYQGSRIYLSTSYNCDIYAFYIAVGGWNISSGQFIQVSFSLNNNYNNDSLDTLVYNDITSYATNSSKTRLFNLELFNVEATRTSNSSSIITYTFVTRGSGNIHYVYFNPDPITLFPGEFLSSNFILATGPVTNNNSDITNSLNGVNNSINSQGSWINESLGTIHRTILDEGSKQSEELQKQTAELQQQTQQQKDQYDQEKAEEADRENEMQGAAEDAAGLFNFSIRNPLEPIFNAFTAGNCVAIPNLARMVGSTETTYCSWFSSSTRAILTPVISIFSIIILFGFVVKWLNKDDGAGE